MIYQSLIYNSFGQPENILKMENRKFKYLKPNNALVKMITTPINPSDLIPITGAYSHRITLPQVPGYEGVGIVKAVSSNEYKHLLGKRVLPLRGEGTWQEYIQSPESLLIPIPETIDDFTAAQLYINPITSWVVCTENLMLERGEILLMNACGSSISSIIIQLSKILGFRVIALTSNFKNKNKLIQLGAMEVIDSKNPKKIDEIMKLTDGMGADSGIDFIGGNDGNDLAKGIKKQGTYLSLGLLSGKQVNWPDIKNNGIHPRLFHLRNWNQSVSIEKWHQTFHNLIELIEKQKIILNYPEKVYDFNNVKQAIEYLSNKKNRGKVFLKMN